jgi:hypothetical protein
MWLHRYGPQTKVVFLGHVISEKGIEPNPDNVANMLSVSPPKTVKEVQQVVGMGSYYRRLFGLEF